MRNENHPASNARHLLENLVIILVKTRFPENIGMAARACANMGCPTLRLVLPQRWNLHKAQKLATPKGLTVLNNMEIFQSLKGALSDCNAAFGTTARTGGWRKALCSPETAASQISLKLQAGERIALVFGPEDRGLENTEILSCMALIHIRAEGAASSLNLSQAVLLALYECSKAARRCQSHDTSPKPPIDAGTVISLEELNMLETAFKRVLGRLDCRQGKNPEYHFMQWHNIFARASLRRHELDALMGLCRQIENKLDTRQ